MRFRFVAAAAISVPLQQMAFALHFFLPGVETCLFSAHFILKTEYLPRQAQDKRRRQASAEKRRPCVVLCCPCR